MRAQPSHSRQDRPKPSSRLRPVLLASGFLALAIGAFALTLTGPWIWLGASLWALAGMIFIVHLVGTVGNPTRQPDKEAHLQQQLKEIDLQCEHLQDQNWELREAEQKYRTLLDRQDDILLHLDDNGHIRYANDAFERYFEANLSHSPFLPDPASGQLVTDEGDDPHTGGRHEGEPLWERQMPTKQGDTWFRWTETLMRTSLRQGGGDGLRLLIARDITAYKRMEAASEAKSRFLATISHEMRTPLNGIIGMANLLDSTPLSAEQSNYNQALRQSGTALLALVNDVLDLSRIEAGKLTLRSEWTSPARLMEDVLELLAPDAQEKGLSVASWVGQSVPDKMLIDPVRVRQILVNLLGNAIKFTNEGAINLSLDCEGPLLDGEQATLLLSVRDTGPGISESMISRLFEEFEQADQSTTRPHDGAGLGLAISRRLARLMDGDIDLVSRVGKGSTFTLRLKGDWLTGDEQDAVTTDTGDGHPPVAPQEAVSLRGHQLVGIDLTQADSRALYAYCQDWGIDFHPFSLEDWQQTGTDMTPDHLLINGAEPDKVACILAGFDPLRGGSLTRPLPQSRIILLEPGERRVIPQMRDSGITAYLVKPVRQSSLYQALLGHPALRAHPDFPDQTDQTKRTDQAGGEETLAPPAAAAHILLVEDNEINALLASTALQKAGMTISMAKSGEAALELYASGAQFDLALLDLHMPDMDGITLFDALECRDAALGRSIPKLAFTADALEETRQQCLNHGFGDFIVKPVEPDTLVEIIRKSLGQGGNRHNSVL
ncbi:response regulator [Cohaesibacter sp. CAU 1516]|uniref:PAS domain-containing hybrid sensor histidine kinase/response regulator n=1 Tax=Cohaesibacter sp. CAU 1516 TaxID=2576038 RepID=UPI0010FD8ABA|nr:PAS domain-containing hybrid sensor histidine kinase/response regulator [Cohaesibacter sp. CAU 1516]TLP47210.1 response regulator [Cohaesibacter sp. CAU 1516]